MSLPHSLKFDKKSSVSHTSLEQEIVIEAVPPTSSQCTLIVPRGWYSKSVVSVLTSQIHSETEMTNSVTRFKNCQRQTVAF